MKNKNGYTVLQEKKSVIENDGKEIESVVYTNHDFAKKVIDYYQPTGLCLDPCRGDGAFYNYLPEPREWCEIQEGIDFFNYTTKVDWIITNPPWRGKVYAPFAKHCFDLADNVVFLVKLFGAIGTHRRIRDYTQAGHALKEVVLVNWNDADFTYIDGSKKSGEGFILSLCYWQRGYMGGTNWTDWTK